MNMRKFKDLFAERAMLTLCLAVFSFVLLMFFGLYEKSRPVLAAHNLREIFFSGVWHPSQGQFGLASFISGTLWVTGIALFLAVPLGLLTSIYLVEYASKKAQRTIYPIIDVLAGISPVIYGFWGVVAVVPLVRDYLMPFFSSRFPFFPFASENYTGFSALTGGIVLAIMILPIMIAIMQEVLAAVPFGIREASLALGATKWQTVKYVLLKKAWPGMIAAMILGTARAFGETIAVLMVAGCALGITPKSMFDPAYPLPALIANTYGEMMSIPLYDAAVLLAALVLFLITALFNMAGQIILLGFEAKEN